jgi:hypothetical protein
MPDLEPESLDSTEAPFDMSGSRVVAIRLIVTDKAGEMRFFSIRTFVDEPYEEFLRGVLPGSFVGSGAVALDGRMVLTSEFEVRGAVVHIVVAREDNSKGARFVVKPQLPFFEEELEDLDREETTGPP